jgi:hypothetical protein|tara:strand:- start:46823 stop:48637 length:1815 start_codon:yes stop_codon:yes gene_type:complete
MSYKLNKTDGSLLVDLVDGQLDTTTTDISLIGKNYTGFGESLNENLIKMLENFSKASAPTNPLIGQLWYDTATQRVKVYDGVGFRTSGSPSVQPQQPSGMVAGDLWIDSDDNKLYFYDGSQLELAGPIYSAAQGKTGPEVVTLIDTFNNSQIVIKWNIAGTTVGVWSNTEFTPAVGYTVAGITGDIKKGFTPVASDDFRFRGIADEASALRDSLGNVKSAEKFLPADSSATTTGTLTVQNSGGLTIGLAQNNILKVVGTSFVSENQLSNHDWKVRVRKPSGFIDALVVDTSEEHFGVFKTDPQYALHVGGDMKVEGELLIGGASVFVETQNLRVEDKNIELAIQSDSSTGNNAAVDGGGIILKSSQLDKELIWKNTTQAWTSSENMDLAATKGYKVDGVEVLNKTEIGSTVTQALGVTQIGTLTTLSVDDVTINGNTISTGASGLQITSTGAIAITNNQRITGLADPTQNQDASTKYYVDDQINTEPVIMNLDISDGITNAQMATIIEDIYPAGNKKVGTFAYVTTTSMAGINVTGIDVGAVATKSFISVDSNGVQNESVLRDIAFTNATGTSTPTIARGLKRFIVVGTTWVFNGDISSSGGLW